MSFNFRSLPTLFIQAALVTTAAVLALVLITKYVAPIPLTVSETVTQKDTAFNVSGKSTIATTPDKAVITVGVSKSESNLKQAQSDANGVINTLQQKLSDLGIQKDDIKTQNYSISPNIDYQNPGQNITGYSVNISLSINVLDFTKINQVIDTATAVGANQVGGIVFTLSDTKEQQVKSEARAQAIADAKRNAQELANLSGMKLGRIINVSEDTSSMPSPIPFTNDKVMAVGSVAPVPTSIEPGSTNYTYTVVLSYETY